MSSKKWLKENKEKVKKYKRDYYNRNKKSEKRRILKRKEDIKQWFKNYKNDLFCENCGEDHNFCLEFHHINNEEKQIEISTAVARGWSIESIKQEIKKCKVLCANCHRKLHYKDDI